MNQRVRFPWNTVVVVGLARSGAAAVRLLAAHGVQVRGTDLRSSEELGLDLDQLDSQHVSLALGEHPLELLDGADLIAVSPGINKSIPFLQEAERRGIPRLGELELAARCARAPLAAVTGTNGKSTCVTILGALLEALEIPHAVAGNVGRPLSDAVESVPESGALAVEVSSYQLEDIALFHPKAAAILNVTPDHLDRYDSFEHYRSTKLNVFKNQNHSDAAVLPAGDSVLTAAAGRLKGRVLQFGRGLNGPGASIEGDALTWRDAAGDARVLLWEDFPLAGEHNRLNAAAALCLAVGLGADPADRRLAEGLKSVRALPHRLEFVGTAAGVRFFDDSKATNPESLEVALTSFHEPVVLLAGGLAKDSDYGELAGVVQRHAAEVVLIGAGADVLEAAWRGTGLPLHRAGTDFETAVRTAFARARELGAVVLLSPGCASFDMFADFTARGFRFQELRKALAAEVGA